MAVKKPRNKSPHLKKKAFLSAFAQVGNVSRAAEAAGVDRTAHYRWLSEGKKYREAFDDATEAAADVLVAEARRRAVEGLEKPVGWYKGEPGGYVQEYSDTLLIVLLKMCGRFVDKREHTGRGGGPIEITEVCHDLGSEDDAA